MEDAAIRLFYLATHILAVEVEERKALEQKCALLHPDLLKQEQRTPVVAVVAVVDIAVLETLVDLV
jgi:hypothetical protein